MTLDRNVPMAQGIRDGSYLKGRGWCATGKCLNAAHCRRPNACPLKQVLTGGAVVLDGPEHMGGRSDL